MAIEKPITDKIREQKAFTILELLIALIITGILTTAMYQLYLTQHKNYLIQNDITNVQQNARATIDELSRQLRMAGFQLPQGLTAITPSNSDPDTITITYKAGSCDSYLTADMSSASAGLECAGDISCFDNGQWSYIYEIDSGAGEWFEVTEVEASAGLLQHTTMPLSKAYSANAIIVAMTRVKYFIDNTTDPDHPMLMMQRMGQLPQVYAEDITDLQFSYLMKSGLIKDQPAITDNIREVIISIRGRSSNPDPERPTDPYRERMFVTSVNPRNIGN